MTSSWKKSALSSNNTPRQPETMTIINNNDGRSGCPSLSFEAVGYS